MNMIKTILKGIGLLFVMLMLVVYLIPRDFETQVPDQPYENSVFYTTSQGIKLHGQFFEAKGESKGKILLIHGLGASSFSYRNNAPFLSENGYDVLAIDLPAFGYSDKSLDIDHSQVARATYLWEWLEAFDKGEKDTRAWHLVGHSMGGSTVLAMANQNPEKTASMNLISGAVTQDNPQIPWLLDSPIGEWLKVALRYFLLNEESFTSTLGSAYNRVPTNVEVKGYLDPLITQGSTYALVDFVKSADNVLISELNVKNIDLNVFWGREDSWVPIQDIETIQAVYPIEDVVLFEGEGHCAHETATDFNERFLAALEN
jgi:2-hydroxy-6-oxonona-2,4-dienedioate hydrolase